jgi:hypothetical protein
MKIIAGLLLLLLFSGCKKEEEPEPVTQAAPDLIGYWKMSGYSNYWTVDPPNEQIETGSDTGSLQFWFHADSTYRLLSVQNNIFSDTGSFSTGYGIIGLESAITPPFPPVLYAPRYNFDAYGKLLLTFTELAEYPLNDTGATPVLGDYFLVVHTYSFTRQ